MGIMNRSIADEEVRQIEVQGWIRNEMTDRRNRKDAAI